ncbi:3-oxoacyl-[acyl-carrier-protein] synthase II [Murinocardiopsis flavida]|uniref:3-oxoacyl-[acyl-carrier-protein] synthase II n=1 Tax=Murinocardiopsis flavida TaxID=645275 RepID=A0A2P8DS00_9ACTN|nr:beta-ketoacyl synthase N-terminal-like domain-containing protein [Murinocardiopsis flavida]PSK99987.1 3-oxoacyl-[acyl-carrier-protein] synthase II [Murinocardiopsis flavida]
MSRAGPGGGAPPVVSAWSAVSCFGIGRSAFTAAMAGGARPPAVAAAPCAPRPDDAVYPVPSFDPRAVLGRKGTRTMDRVSGFAVAAARELLGGTPDASLDAGGGDRTAVVLATAGNPQAMRDFTRASLTAAKPFHVDPAVIPSGVPNCAAGLVAIWNGLTGPNTTINTGRAAALNAVGHARRLLVAGRADRVIVGAFEAHSATRARLDPHRAQPGEPGAPGTGIGEGGAVFLLENAAACGEGPREPLLDVLHVAHRTGAPDDFAAAVRGCVEEALDRSGLHPGQVWAARGSECAGEPGRQERRVLAELFAPEVCDRVRPPGNGDTGSAVAAFQIAAALAVPAPPDAPVAIAVTAVDPGGTAACAVLRRRPQGRA